MLIGNYSFYFPLVILINLSNFDDNFLISILPNPLLSLLGLDLGILSIVQPPQKTQEELIREQRQKFLIRDQSKKESLNSFDSPKQTEDEKNPQINIINDSSKASNKMNAFTIELVTFFNLFSITIVFTFYYLFPLQELVNGNIKLYASIFLKYVLNIYFLSYFILAIYFFIIIKFSVDNYDFFQKELKSFNYKKRISKYILFFKYILKRVLFLLLVTMYILSCMSSFYTDLKLKITDPFVSEGIKISNTLLKKFHVSNNYGLFNRIQGLNGRLELEFLYNEKESQFSSLDFYHKTNQKRLLFPSIFQKRIEWQLEISAYSPEINFEPWIAILIGKLIERNPVTLDLLGYATDNKRNMHKCKLYYKVDSLIEKLFKNRPEFPIKIEKIKVDKYKYFLNNFEALKKTGNFWKTSLFNNYFTAVNFREIIGVLEHYELPFDKDREIKISPFQKINVPEIVLFIISLYLVRKLFM